MTTSKCDYGDVVRQLRTWLARSKLLLRLDFPVAASEIELRRVRAENEHKKSLGDAPAMRGHCRKGDLAASGNRWNQVIAFARGREAASFV